jgi:hypothetical protein
MLHAKQENTQTPDDFSGNLEKQANVHMLSL